MIHLEKLEHFTGQFYHGEWDPIAIGSNPRILPEIFIPESPDDTINTCWIITFSIYSRRVYT